MAKTEFVWLAESTPLFEKNHLYRAVDCDPAMVRAWIETGAAAWREDVPPEKVIIDLRPQGATQRTISRQPKMEVQHG